MARLESVACARLRVPLHTPFVTALRRTETTDTVVVRVTDSDGVVGWGEAPQVWQVTGESLASATACLEEMLAPVVVGRDVDDWLEVSGVAQRAVARNFGAKAALDVALHDLAARRARMPLSAFLAQLTGGGSSGDGADGADRADGDGLAGAAAARALAGSGEAGARVEPGRVAIEAALEANVETDAGAKVETDAGAKVETDAWASVETDVTLSAGSVDALGATALARVADGFGTLKMKVGTDAATDVARVRAVREAVGPAVVLRLDANQGWSREEAVVVIRALEDADLDVELVEQPVAGDDVEGLAWVRARVGLPVMADESLYSLVDLDRILRLGAADLVNVKLAKCGSLTVAATLLVRAREAGLGTMVGTMMETPIGVGAAASLVAAHPTSTTNDLDAAWWGARSPVVGGLTYAGSRLTLPAAPGLGIDALVAPR